MYELFRNGGWGMYPIVLFGFAALATSGYFAMRGDGRTKGFLGYITYAMAWSMLTSLASNLIAVNSYVQSHPLKGDELAITLLQGFAEALSPIVLGPAFLTAVYLLAAVGQRKLDAKAA